MFGIDGSGMTLSIPVIGCPSFPVSAKGRSGWLESSSIETIISVPRLSALGSGPAIQNFIKQIASIQERRAAL